MDSLIFTCHTGKIESDLESYASDSGSRDTRLNSSAAKQLSYIDDNGLPHFKSSSVAIDKDVQKIMKKKSSSSESIFLIQYIHSYTISRVYKQQRENKGL